VHVDAPSSRSLAEVQYGGTIYRVAHGTDEPTGRSSETLSLLANLLSLHQRASDLPRVQPVRLLPY
jgi:hypothetical protein